MPRLRVVLLVVLCAAGALGGCGNKGPLYLPDGGKAPAELPDTDELPTGE